MDYILDAKDFLITTGAAIGLTIIKALLVLVIGWQIAKFLSRSFGKLILKHGVDPSLQVFLKSLVHNLLIILLLLSVLSTLGVEMTSFIAILGAAGLAVGLALQGSLSNFAGGILILLLKPFKVGDVIEAQGVTASVTEIQIFHTLLKSFDNKVIIIPNAKLSNDIIINYSMQTERTVEWIFSISYTDDIDHVRSIIKEIIFTDSRVLNSANPFIHVGELTTSSVNMKVRAVVLNTSYWDVYLEKLEAIKKAFDKEGITFPSTHKDVYLYQKKED